MNSQPAVLMICVPAPVLDIAGGYHLDVKFVEGMRRHVADWGGKVHCIMWRGATSIPFGRGYRADELGFDLTVLDQGAPLPQHVLRDSDVALISADMADFAGLSRAAVSAGLPVVVGLEYTFQTRMQIVWLDRNISSLRKLRRSLWLWRKERQMKAQLRRVQGAQFNGYPACDAYSRLTANPYLYLDNRMSADIMAQPVDMTIRAERLLSGQPLRLIHSGRLEPMKGAQDVLSVMRALRGLGVQATLDIYGTGSLEADIRSGLPEFSGSVRLHAPIDFRTELVPISRTQADVFLSCHRQSDPSCTYLEAMGCGLAIAGYSNQMWQRLRDEAGAGLVVPVGRPDLLAQAIAGWDSDRHALIKAAETGLDFARQHDFDSEFSGRMAHLRLCLQSA